MEKCASCFPSDFQGLVSGSQQMTWIFMALVFLGGSPCVQGFVQLVSALYSSPERAMCDYSHFTEEELAYGAHSRTGSQGPVPAHSTL